jgi:hypothetical protein
MKRGRGHRCAQRGARGATGNMPIAGGEAQTLHVREQAVTGATASQRA